MDSKSYHKSKEYHKQYYKENKAAIKARRLETAKRQAASNTAAKEWKAANINNLHIFQPFHNQHPVPHPSDSREGSFRVVFEPKKLLLLVPHE
jgi:hypothetical protein